MFNRNMMNINEITMNIEGKEFDPIILLNELRTLVDKPARDPKSRQLIWDRSDRDEALLKLRTLARVLYSQGNEINGSLLMEIEELRKLCQPSSEEKLPAELNDLYIKCSYL